MNYQDLGDGILQDVMYRGEGNSSIVIALKGHAKVIRLLKKDGKIMKTSQDHHISQHPMRNIEFIHLIMKPLTHPFLNSATELIHLKSDFINKLSQQVEANRPAHRLDKTLVLDDQYALVMDDLCTLPVQLFAKLGFDDLIGPSISVEIKPKQGFLPLHRLYMRSTANDEFASKLRHCCIYGSTQYLKMARGRISKTSDYCPIDLFSGCPVRMKTALEALIKNPQNNLRVFKDLVLAYGDNSDFKLDSVLSDFFEPINGQSNQFKSTNDTPGERLTELLIQCLLNDSCEINKELNGSRVDYENFNNSDTCMQHASRSKCKRCDYYPSLKRHKTEVNNISHQLPKSCVLSSVLKAQKLDSIGPQKAYRMLEWLLDESRKDHGRKGRNFIEELSMPQMPNGFGSPHQLANESKHDYYFRKVWEFLVSLTAKDCSIIITIKRLVKDKFEQIVTKEPRVRSNIIKEHKTGDYFMFNVGIADLDQKMPLKIPRICEHLNLILQNRGVQFEREAKCFREQSTHQLLVDST